MRNEVQGSIGPDHPALPGHFPGSPVVPGVVILTHVLNAIERQVGWTTDNVALISAKFSAPLRPGEPFSLCLDPLPEQRISFAVLRGETRIASGMLRQTGPPNGHNRS